MEMNNPYLYETHLEDIDSIELTEEEYQRYLKMADQKMDYTRKSCAMKRPFEKVTMHDLGRMYRAIDIKYQREDEEEAKGQQQ